MRKIIAAATLTTFVIVGTTQVPFDKINEQLHDPIIAHIFCHIGNFHDSEDLYQEVLFVIAGYAKNGKAFAGDEHLRGFAYRTADNFILHYYRDHGASIETPMDTVIERAMTENVFDPSVACDRMLVRVSETDASILLARLRGQKVPRRTYFNAKEAAKKAWEGTDFFEAM